jgi:prepilin-type N-terminal cleavage/methylation domain-containing protein
MNKKTTSGLTLVELVITIAVAGILAGLAIPSFRDMIQNNRMASHANELVSSVNLARNEAVKRGVQVKIKAAGTATDNEWGKGWKVWVDDDGDGTINGTEVVLRDVGEFNSSIELDSTGNTSLFVYQADGSLGAAQTLRLCDSTKSGEKGREITIAPSGRVSVSDYTCS